MIGRTNAEIPASDNVTTVTLTSGASGVTITASITGKTRTAITNSSGVATFNHLDMGYDWTFTDGTNTVTERIDDLSEAITLGIMSIEVHYYQEESSGWVRIFEGTGTSGTKIFEQNVDQTYQWLTLGTFNAIPGDVFSLGKQNNAHMITKFTKNSENGESLLSGGVNTTNYYPFTVTADMQSIWIKTYDF